MITTPTNITTVDGKIVYWIPEADYKVRKVVDKNFKPYFYVTDDSGDYNTIYGFPVSKFEYDQPYQRQEIVDLYNPVDVFESDVKFETRWLIDNCSGLAVLNKELPKIRTWLFDIETLIGDKGFPNVSKADNEIPLISIYDTKINKIITLAVPPVFDPNQVKEDFVFFPSEQEMLQFFMKFIIQSEVQLISGWNTEEFDLPYIIHRIDKLFGQGTSRKLSPVNDVHISQAGGYKIAGITHLDYLALYKKFEINNRDSYTLDAIAKLELNMTKLEYDSSLDDLYQNNFMKFAEYNRQDVNILVELDNKKKYFDLARELTTIANVPLEYVYFNTKLVDGFILSQLKPLKIVVPDKPAERTHTHFEGAYVMDPKPGLYDWVLCLDLVSLYPSVIRSLNLSPETLLDETTANALDVRNTQDYFKAANDSYYIKDRRGVIPVVLDKLFELRLSYKDLMKKAKRSGDEDLAQFYKSRQYIIKIILNSVYGYLGSPATRFYNTTIAEAVTLTAQMVTRSSVEFTKHLKYYVDCIYADTDSLYVSLPEQYDTIEKCVEVGKLIQSDINRSLDLLVKDKCNIDLTKNEKHFFRFNFEKVCKTILLVTKKRYAYHEIWNDSDELNCDSIGVTGIEVVRSDTPQVCRDFMRTVLDMVLKKVDKTEVMKYVQTFKEQYKKFSVEEQAIPVGVHGVSKYTDATSHLPKKGSPAHIKAAIFYNKMIASKNKNIQQIRNNEKIRWFYVKNNVVDVMGFINYLPQLKEYEMDMDKMLERLVNGKVDTIFEALGWSLLSSECEEINDLFA